MVEQEEFTGLEDQFTTNKNNEEAYPGQNPEMDELNDRAATKMFESSK